PGRCVVAVPDRRSRVNRAAGLKQGFAWWSFATDAQSAASLLEAAATVGYTGVDFLPQELWPRARDLGLDPIIIDGHMPLESGFNNPACHAVLSSQVRTGIALAAAERIPLVAVASGDRVPGATCDGLAACVEGLA